MARRSPGLHWNNLGTDCAIVNIRPFQDNSFQSGPVDSRTALKLPIVNVWAVGGSILIVYGLGPCS